MKLRPLAPLAVVALAVVSHSAVAEPMVTDLPTVRRDAATIVVGTVTSVSSGTATLNVDAALRGTKPASAIKMGAPTARHEGLLGQRVVAFADANNELRWYGHTIAGPDLEHGVLLLAGFYDFNAHFVTPGMMTFPQLTGYLATGVFPSRTFVGTVGFPDGHGGIAPSSKHFVVHVAGNGATKVTGFALSCLAPPTSLFGLDWGDFTLSFEDTCAKSGPSRSLRLSGATTGVDAAGNITVLVSPAAPILTQSEYDTFAADGAIADVRRTVRFTAPNGTAWSWSVDDTLTDGSTARNVTTGHGTSIAPPGPRGTVREDTWSYGDVTLKLTQTGPAAGQASLGNTRDVVAAVDRRIGTWTIERKGGAPVPVAAAQGAPTFVRR
jgi:hypothetical protein